MQLKNEHPSLTFKPAWWCRGRHAQTIFGGLPRRTTPVVLNRKRLELPDGDFLDVDFLETSSNGRQDVPSIIILHGLEGSSQSPYVQGLLGEVKNRGWNAIAMNMRMCSGTPNRLKQSYHSGKTEDLDFLVNYLSKDKVPMALYLVGFSIGGNIMLKWLGEQGSRASQYVRGAAAVSVPYDLAKSVELMDKGFNRGVYTRALLASLKAKAIAKRRRFPDVIRYDLVRKCRSFREFDREATAPLNGFADEEDYWSKTSCIHFLQSVRVKTLLIHADDDPFFPGHLLPWDRIKASDYFETLIVPCGGHLGFVSGRSPWKRETWLENRVLDFFHAIELSHGR